MSENDDALIAGFWRALAATGWHGLSMRQVAAEAGVSPAALRRRFATPLDVLVAHGRATDAAVLEGTVPDPLGTARDRLFDVLMRRLDEMQRHRPGVVRLLDDLPRAPLAALALAPHLAASMAWMLEAAGLEASGPKGLARIQGLTLVWLSAVRAWQEDDSTDLSATMAALDKALDRAEKAARWLRLDGPEAEAPPVAEPPASGATEAV
ncbi:TetR family transcriptional regulator [Roseococcus sp. DSY-14]|uniref:TetR family transcriptional regulator n=1 Tax=Roseococcus sp. DSY-14 TaxID=3369650 RepID=UPI00387B830B